MQAGPTTPCAAALLEAAWGPQGDNGKMVTHYERSVQALATEAREQRELLTPHAQLSSMATTAFGPLMYLTVEAPEPQHLSEWAADTPRAWRAFLQSKLGAKHPALPGLVADVEQSENGLVLVGRLRDLTPAAWANAMAQAWPQLWFYGSWSLGAAPRHDPGFI